MSNLEVLRKAILNASGLKDEYVIIKFGGEVLQSQFFEKIIQDVVLLRLFGIKVIIVHGAGPQINKALSEAGFEIRKKDGIRETTEEMMEVIKPTCDQATSDIIKIFDEDKVVRAVRMQRIFAKKDVGGNGLISSVDPGEFQACFISFSKGQKNIFVPVVSNVIKDVANASLGGYKYLNVNADQVASGIASSLEAKMLILMTNTDGVLDISGATVPIIKIGAKLPDNVTGGMLVKVEGAVAACVNGTEKCRIINYAKEDSLFEAIFSNSGGTIVE